MNIALQNFILWENMECIALMMSDLSPAVSCQAQGLEGDTAGERNFKDSGDHQRGRE